LTVTDSNGLNDNNTVNILVKHIPEQTPSAANPPTTNAADTSNNPPIAGIVPAQTPSAANPPTTNAADTSNIARDNTTTANGILTANAGSDITVQAGALVTLDGSNSTGSIASYSWKQIGGKSVKLTDLNTARSAFIAPDVKKDSILKFRLSVDDYKGKRATSTVNILVVNNNSEITN
jgi:hypothetical protein